MEQFSKIHLLKFGLVDHVNPNSNNYIDIITVQFNFHSIKINIMKTYINYNYWLYYYALN